MGSSGRAYRPAPSVTTSRTAPVPSLRAVTTAPGRAPFDVSITVPETDPIDCACTGAAGIKAAAMMRVVTRNHGSLILHLPAWLCTHHAGRDCDHESPAG